MAEFLTEDNLEDYSVEMVDPVTYINYKGQCYGCNKDIYRIV